MEVPSFPAKIKIGYYTYLVEDWPPDRASLAQRFGECDRNEKVIRVCRQHGDHKAADTLLHETMHALYSEYKLEDADLEERTVGALALGLSGVFLDNPEFLRWFSWAITQP